MTAPVQYGPRAAALKGSATTQEMVRATFVTVVGATVCRHGGNSRHFRQLGERQCLPWAVHFPITRWWVITRVRRPGMLNQG